MSIGKAYIFSNPGPLIEHSDTSKPKGIDVSNHQGIIDWHLVAHSGIQFAFIKATEGGTYQDLFFEKNLRDARAAGVPAGPYHFFRPKGPVANQLTNFLTIVKTSEVGDLPPVLDLEVPNDWGHFKVHERVELVHEFLTEVEKALGRNPIIYMSASFSKDILAEAALLKDYPLWVAHHTTAANPWVPKPWTFWSFWQHSDKGTIDGINGAVDLNWFNGSQEQLQKFQKV